MFSLRRIVIAGAAVVLAATAITGCTSGSTSDPGSSAASGGTLTIGTVIPSSTFAVKDAPWANESPYLQAVYDSLLHAKPDGSIEPWLATKWSYNQAKTVLTMTLRDDVTFTDGTKFTAGVAAQNLLRFRDGTSPQKSYLATLADAKAIDDTSLELTLSQPNPSLLSFLTQNPGLMESPKNFDNPSEKTDPVGTGPYVLDTKDTVVGSTYVFTKNDKYFAPEDQHYAKIVMNVYTTPTAIINAIKGGQINGAPLSDNSSLDQVKAAGYTANDQQLNFFGVLLYDRGGQSEKALADVRVRQAINYAFDKKALLKAVGRGYGTVTAQIFSPDSDGYVKSLDSAYPYNPAKAKELLKEAGYADGAITLTQPQSPGFAPAAYALLKQYLNVVGIKVDYVAEGNANFLPDMLAAKFPTALMQLKAAPTTWETISLDLAPKAGWNPFHYQDPKVDALVKTIQTGSSAEAAKAAKELNTYVVDQAWFAPWYRPQQTYASDANTTVAVQVGNAYPYLWNFVPKS